ncbi:MAG: hypothetical protein ACTSP4_15175 [Candidatus Hodarchaeales archaeon]
MSNSKKIISYKYWKPVMTEEEVFSGVIGIGGIQIDSSTSNLFWLESRPAEKGRIVLIRRNDQGKTENVTPEGFYIRTRVHEYGGSSYAVKDDNVYFVNFMDQRIYHQDLSSDRVPKPITPKKNSDGSTGKYAALQLTTDGKALIFVYEKEYTDKENLNFIAAIHTNSSELTEPFILASGNDFYGEPVLSPDNSKIAWVTWNHPNMPWDSTELVIAEFNPDDLTVKDVKVVAGGNGASICFPKFTNREQLFFIMDEPGHQVDDPKNWWNFYRYDFDTGKVAGVTKELVEFGAPMWVLGTTRYAFLEDSRIITVYRKNGSEFLGILNLTESQLQKIDLPLISYFAIHSLYKQSVHRISISAPLEQTFLQHCTIMT